MNETPQREHQWLQRLTGEWVLHGMTSPDCPASGGGKESVRPLGEFWVVLEGEGEMPGGGTARTRMTLGYDPQKKRYVGTWVGSMMSHLWVYEGTLEGNVLTLETEGPAMSGEGRARYRDVIEFDGGDRRLLISAVLGDGGAWREFMRAEYRRVP